MTTLRQAEQHARRVKKHAELMTKLMHEEGMGREEASRKAYQLIMADARRKITAKMRRR